MKGFRKREDLLLFGSGVSGGRFLMVLTSTVQSSLHRKPCAIFRFGGTTFCATSTAVLPLVVNRTTNKTIKRARCTAGPDVDRRVHIFG